MPYDDRSKLYIMMDERQSIKDSLKCLRKYGSTSNNNYSKLPDECIKHIVTDSDTLQGIALKYGVSVSKLWIITSIAWINVYIYLFKYCNFLQTEQIRRVNKLWANDSLFLRESLLIPVKSKSLPSTSMSSFDSPSEQDLFVNQSMDDVKPSHNGFCRSDSGRSSTSSYRNDEDLDNVDKFLNRIDADIANKTQQVKMTQTKSS